MTDSLASVPPLQLVIIDLSFQFSVFFFCFSNASSPDTHLKIIEKYTEHFRVYSTVTFLNGAQHYSVKFNGRRSGGNR